MRAETGRMKFGDDWTGIFIRGDAAFGYASQLQGVLGQLQSGTIEYRTVNALIELLLSSKERNMCVPQKMRAFDECTSSKTDVKTMIDPCKRCKGIGLDATAPNVTCVRCKGTGNEPPSKAPEDKS